MHTMRKWFAACAAALLLFAGGTAWAETIYRTITSHNDLVSAIAATPSGGTLVITPPATPITMNLDDAIDIWRPITIRSSDPDKPIHFKRIQGAAGEGFFKVSCEPVVLCNFWIEGQDKILDSSREHDCAIRSTSKNLTLSYCTIENWQGDVMDADNSSIRDLNTSHAGAVTASGGAGSQLILDHCTFKGCAVYYKATSPMLYNYTWNILGGAVSSKMGKTIVRNCSFIGNRAESAPGASKLGDGIGALSVTDTNDDDAGSKLLVADSTFADNTTFAALNLFTAYAAFPNVIGSTFVHNAGTAVRFDIMPYDVCRTSRLRLANCLLLGNDYNGDCEYQDICTYCDDQVLMCNTVIGSVSSDIARQNCYVAGRDNWTQWFLNVENGVPQPFLNNKVRGVDHYAYPLSPYAYQGGRNVSAPLLYDNAVAYPTVNKGLSMKSNPTVLWYGDSVGTSTLHTQGVDGKDCYDEWEDEYHFSCGSDMSYPVNFVFKKSGNNVATQKVMWNYGSVTMPSVGLIPAGYKFLGWDGLYDEGEVVPIDELMNTVYMTYDNEITAVIAPITYAIEYRGFNASFDPEYHRQTNVLFHTGWVEGWSGVPIYGGLLNCTNEAADVEAYDYACYGYTCKGWATSKERAQAGLVDYEFGQMLGSEHTGGVDLTTTDGATVTLWLVRSANQGCVRFYSDSYKTNWVDYPAVTRQAFTVPECSFIPEPGHQFKNWSLGYEQPFKNPGDVIYVTVEDPGEVAASFVAEWEACSGYSIHYHNNGGTGGEIGVIVSMQNPQPQTVYTAEEAGVSRGGYTFMGWSKTSGDGNTVDYLPGRSAWGLTTSTYIDLYAVWQPATGSARMVTATDATYGQLTFIFEILDPQELTCSLLRVITENPIVGDWTIPDVIHEATDSITYDWKVVSVGQTLASDLANVPVLKFGNNLTANLELLRDDGGTGNRKAFRGSNEKYWAADGMLVDIANDDQVLLAVPCGWNDASGSGVLDIPATIKYIAKDACKSLKYVRTVIIPEGILQIRNNAFADNYGASLEVTGDGGISQVYFRGAFDSESQLQSPAVFGETDWGAQVCQPIIRYSDKVVIGYMPCQALGAGTCTVTVPEGVSAIADNAFEECAQMAAVSLPSTLGAIGECAFATCENLTAVDIPAAVTNVSNYAFYGCTSLASLTGGAGLLGVDFSVGTGIISNTKLQQDADAATSAEGAYVTIGGGIGTGYDCILVYHGANDTMGLNLLPGLVGIAGGAVYNDRTLYTAEIPHTVRWIGDYAFDYCQNLDKIRLCVTTKTSPCFAPLHRNAITDCEIEVYGFGACDTIDGTFRISLGDEILIPAIAVPLKLVIGTGINKITGSAFACNGQNDAQVKSVTGGADLVSVSRGAFANTTWATTEASPEPGSVATGYPHRNIGGFYVGYFGPSENSLTMPETDALSGANITRLSPTAFSDCSFNDLTLASQLEAGQVTPALFDGNISLSWLTIDAAAPNYATEEGVLYNKDKTALLVYPREKTGDFTLPDTVVSIAEGAFQYAKVYNLTIPNTSALTTIPAHAFEMSSVTSVTLGDRVSVIGESAFAYCFALEAVTFGQGLSRIEDMAFNQCKISALDFPKTLDTIGASVFSSNDYLTDVTFRGDAPACADSAFAYLSGVTAHVYADSKGWNGDPTSSVLPDPAVWKGLNLEHLQDNFANWAAYNGLKGDDAEYLAKPAKWGGKWENAFVYLFGEGIVDGSKPLMTMTFGSDGVPRIMTPKPISRDDDDFYAAVVIGSQDVGSWKYPHYVFLTTTAPGEPDPGKMPPEGYEYWWLNEGQEANFFRVKLYGYGD